MIVLLRAGKARAEVLSSVLLYRRASPSKVRKDSEGLEHQFYGRARTVQHGEEKTQRWFFLRLIDT